MTAVVGAILGAITVFSSNSRSDDIRPLSDYPSNITRYSKYVQGLNRGCTKSLQSNPNDTETDCYIATTATNLLIDDMFNKDNYVGGAISQAEFQEKFQVMAF